MTVEPRPVAVECFASQHHANVMAWSKREVAEARESTENSSSYRLSCVRICMLQGRRNADKNHIMVFSRVQKKVRRSRERRKYHHIITPGQVELVGKFPFHALQLNSPVERVE